MLIFTVNANIKFKDLHAVYYIKINLKVLFNKKGGYMLNIEKIVYLVGLVIVALTGVGVPIPQGELVIVILGAVSGYFVPESDRRALLVTAIGISVVSGGLGAIPTVGSFITGIVSSLGTMVNAGAVVAVILGVVDKAKG